jgi:hypothetical protein
LESMGIEPMTAYIYCCKAGALPLRQNPFSSRVAVLMEGK